MLACELIDNNGKELLKCVNQYIDQWELEDSFRKYVNEDCTFCSTLVDRIVPGRIRDAAEVARLEKRTATTTNSSTWARSSACGTSKARPGWRTSSRSRPQAQLPGGSRRYPLQETQGSHPERRAHRLCAGRYLAGFDIVRDCMHDDVIRNFMNKMLLEEVVPILPLDQEDCKQFAAAVEDRFNNPFVNHELMSISLNSTSKWRARNMPSLLEYVEKNGTLPTCLSMGLAAYIAFYSNDIQGLTDKGLVCKRPAGNEYTVSDDRWVLEFYNAHKDDDIPTWCMPS